MNKKDCCLIEEETSLKPIYILLIIIVILSLIVSFFFPANTFMMYLMGIWFLVFGILKLYDLRGFVQSFSQYDIIASKWKYYGYIFPFIEITLGHIYIFNTSMAYMTEINIIALGVSILGVMSAYSIVNSGKKITCACMGTYWKLPMTKVTIIENLVMAIMVTAMLFFPTQTMIYDPFKTFQRNIGSIQKVESPMDAMMRDHCTSMPEMVLCDKYK